MTPTPGDQRSLAKRLWPAFVILALFAITALLLRLEGRLWFCSCGHILLWSGNTCSSDNSQHFLDPYAFTHILHGFLFFWLVAWLAPRWRASWQLVLALAAESFWEVFENTEFVINRYRSETAALGYNGDTVVNSLGDILCCLVGFAIARRLGFRRSLIVFLAIELVLIIWIKDSLVLQILMLIYPIDFIKSWQMCR